MAACGAFAAVPPEWWDLPFGAYDAANPGAASEDGGVFTVSGSGTQMYGTNQDGGRTVFKPLAGDGEIIANVERVAYEEGIKGRVGLMFRSNNQKDSATVIFYRAGFDDANPSVIRGQYRTAAAATMAWQNPTLTNTEAWAYLRLVRQGNVITSYYSTNATPTEWQFYNAVTVPMAETVNAGIFVSKYGTLTVKAITNRFSDVVARPLVAVAQAEADALAVSWVSEPPGTNAFGTLTYTLLRGASRTGPFETVADGLTETVYTNTVEVGPTYYYRVDAVSDTFATNLIGVSGGARIVFAETNHVTASVNGYWAESYTHGAEFVVRTSRVVSAVLNTAITNSSVLYKDGYRAYYTATLVPANTDFYYFQTRFDDGGRLWLGDDLIIEDALTLGASRTSYSVPIWLEAGRAVTLCAYHVQNFGTAELTVQWARLGSQTFADIPLALVSPLPSPWRSRDFGLPHLNGFAEYDFAAKQFTVTAGGSADGAAEAGHFAYQAITGDFAMQTCVASQSGAVKKAGLLIRASAADDAARAACYVGDDGLIVEIRAASGGDVTTTLVPVAFSTAAPIRLKVESVGGVLAFFCKENAADAWASMTNLPFALPRTVYAGVAAQSLSDSEANAAVFSETARVGLSVPVAPEADGQVQMSAPDTNYGKNTEMTVKHWDVATTRESFLRFNTTGLSDVRTVRLRLYLTDRAATGAATNQTLIVRRVLDNAWGETNITWAHPPAGVVLPSGLIGTDDPLFIASAKVPAKNEYLDIDLTDAVRASAQADGRLSLLLHTSAIYDANPALFATREYADATKRPALVCYGDGPIGLTAEPGAAANEIALVWRLAEDASATYTIKRATAEEGPYTVIAENVSGYTYYDSGRTPGTRYFYTVTAVTPSWESPASPVVSATCDAVTRGTQEAQADIYVEAGASRDVNKNNSALVIKSSFVEGTFQREVFIKFNVAGMASVQNARLRIMPQTSDEGGAVKSLLTTYVDIEAFASGDWSETAVTWNNSPYGYPLPIRTQDLTWPDQAQKVRFRIGKQGVQQEIDITPLVRRVARISDIMTLHLYRIDNYTDNNCVIYRHEETTAALRPALLYALQRPGAPDAAFTNGLVSVTWPAYAGATSYAVERAAAAQGEFATVAAGLTARTYVDRTALTGERYLYRIVATTASGTTEPSDAAPAVALGLNRLVATADTAIDQAGAAVNVNYGANVEVNLKAFRSGTCREDFFKFDVRGLEEVPSARFRLNIAPRDGGYVGGGVVVYDVTGAVGDWDENTITWNLPPKGYVPPTTNSLAKASNELARVVLPYKVKDSGTHVTFIEADATVAVRAAAAAGRELMLRVCGDDMLPHSQAFFSVATRENAADERRPALLCASASAASPVAVAEVAASNRAVTVSWWPVNGAVSYTVTRLAPDGTETVLVSGTTGTSVGDEALWNGDGHLYTYRVEALYSDGTTGVVTEVAVSVPRTFERRIYDDSFAQSGVNSNAVNGAGLTLGVKNDAGDTARETYLRLSLAGLPPVTGSSLRLTAQSFNTDKAFTLVAEAVEDTGWTETGTGALTWFTARGFGATATMVSSGIEAANRIDVTTLEVGSEAAFDITEMVQSAQAVGQPTLVVHVYSANPGPQKMLWFHSSEAADLGDQPKVTFAVPAYPAPGTVLLLR
jgi:hypothetical protein